MRVQTPPNSPVRRGRKTQTHPAPKARPVARRKQANMRQAKLIQSANPDTTVRKRGNVYFLYHKKRRGISWRLAITILLVFVVGVGVAVSFATIHNVDRQITARRAALTRQLENNLSLDARTVERYTHDEIVRRAHAMGLREPDSSQIVYFYAPVYSQVVFRYTPAIDNENQFWQGVIAFLRGLAERVFR